MVKMSGDMVFETFSINPGALANCTGLETEGGAAIYLRNQTELKLGGIKAMVIIFCLANKLKMAGVMQEQVGRSAELCR